MKYINMALTVIIIFLIFGCYPKPEGYLGLEDNEPPEISVVNPTDGTVFSDSQDNITIQVEAYDFWGIDEVVLFCNGSFYTLMYEPFHFQLDTSILPDTNYICARAYDSTHNSTTTEIVTFYLDFTLINTEPIPDISLLNTDSTFVLILDNYFMDTTNPELPLEYEIISNSNVHIAEISIEDGILSIIPNEFIEGSSIITLEITAGDHRTLIYSFNLIVTLTEPLERVYIPNDNFRELLIDTYNFTYLPNEDYILAVEAEGLTELEITTESITDLEGIQAFINIDSLHIIEPVSELNISDLSLLRHLRLEETNLQELDTSSQDELVTLKILHNYALNSINLSNNGSLEWIVNNNNSNLNTIDVSNNPELRLFSMHMTALGLTSLDFSNNPNLERVHITLSHIEEIDLNGCTSLEYLYLYDTKTQTVDLSSNIALEELYLNPNPYYAEMDMLDLTDNVNLTSFSLHNAVMYSLDISNNVLLEYIDLRENDFLIATYVWELPLPEYIEIFKEEFNIFYTH